MAWSASSQQEIETCRHYTSVFSTIFNGYEKNNQKKYLMLDILQLEWELILSERMIDFILLLFTILHDCISDKYQVVIIADQMCHD